MINRVSFNIAVNTRNVSLVDTDGAVPIADESYCAALLSVEFTSGWRHKCLGDKLSILGPHIQGRYSKAEAVHSVVQIAEELGLNSNRLSIRPEWVDGWRHKAVYTAVGEVWVPSGQAVLDKFSEAPEDQRSLNYYVLDIDANWRRQVALTDIILNKA